MSDLKFAFHQLAKNPGFTAVAVLTLALGIGANTTIFSLVNTVLLRPLPYSDPGRLVVLFENQVSNGWVRVSPGASAFQEWRKQNTVFEGLAAARGYGDFTLSGKGEPEILKGASFSANFFSLLGIKPFLGRDFLPEEERYGNHRVAILSYELWQRRFGGQTNLVGQSLELNLEPYTVIGVMPPRTIAPEGVQDLWTPLAFKTYELTERHAHNFSTYARLKPGVTLKQARATMDLIASRMAEADAQNRGWGAEVHPLHEIVVGDSPRLLLVLLCSVGLVLLIGCANIAGLLLARSVARTREFAIRAALGADRRAMIRQLLTETCLLAVIGGILGVFLTRLGFGLLIILSPPDLPRMAEGIRMDGTTLAFTAVITVVTGMAFGLIPAWQASNPMLSRGLGETARGTSGGPRRQLARTMIVVGEVALSLMLLVGAGLTLRSLQRLLDQRLGYVPEHLVTMSISLPDQRYPGHAERVRLFDPLLTAVRNIPGVTAAGYAFGAPLTTINTTRSVSLRDAPPPAPGESIDAGYAQVSPGYFATLGTPLLQGRDFSDRDDRTTRPVVIVDEAFVKHFGLGGKPLGRRMDLGDGTGNCEIIGVVGGIKRTGMTQRMRGEMYRPYRQLCWGVLTLVVRTPRDPAELTRAIRSELDLLDKDVPLDMVRTMSQLVAANVAPQRLSAQLLSGFAACALLQSALGLYGVLAFTVRQRTREIGIRMALGASRRRMVGWVIGQGMRLILVGLALGIVGGLMFTRVLRQMLYEIKPNDPVTFVAMSLTLAVAALIACWLPARRASRVDPIKALRYE